MSQSHTALARIGDVITCCNITWIVINVIAHEDCTLDRLYIQRTNSCESRTVLAMNVQRNFTAEFRELTSGHALI